MKNKLVFAAALCILAVISISGGFYLSSKRVNTDDERSEYIVALNEINRLNASENYESANEKINALQENMRNKDNIQRGINVIPILCGASVFLFAAMCGYIYP